MKKIICFLLSLCSICAFCSEEHFEALKEKIDKLENTIIQDFSIDYPKTKESFDSKTYAKLASQIEVKYGIQQTLFYKLEKEFFNLTQKIDSEHLAKSLTNKQAKKLRNSIDYATRIILKSRRNEINQMYADFKNSLSHKPKLKELYQKLSHFNVKNCTVKNLSLNAQNSAISFIIEKKNKFGNISQSNFTVTKNDIDSGQITSKLDNYNKFNPFRNIITQYWTSDHTQKKSQSFSILQDENGNIKTANFQQESTIPFIDFMGFQFGEQSVTKSFECISNKVIKGSRPASLPSESNH